MKARCHVFVRGVAVRAPHVQRWRANAPRLCRLHPALSSVGMFSLFGQPSQLSQISSEGESERRTQEEPSGRQTLTMCQPGSCGGKGEGPNRQASSKGGRIGQSATENSAPVVFPEKTACTTSRARRTPRAARASAPGVAVACPPLGAGEPSTAGLPTADPKPALEALKPSFLCSRATFACLKCSQGGCSATKLRFRFASGDKAAEHTSCTWSDSGDYEGLSAHSAQLFRAALVRLLRAKATRISGTGFAAGRSEWQAETKTPPRWARVTKSIRNVVAHSLHQSPRLQENSARN